MDRSKSGVLLMVVACMIWGLSALYYKLLAHVPPLEVLSHRTIWSMLFFSGLLALQGRLGEVSAALSTRRSAAIIGVAALAISTNWFLFIFSVQIGLVRETSLGYYIFPLVAVLIGVFAYGERLGALQWAAVALAAAAVTILTVGLGTAPWVSLLIAMTFGLYGLVKKGLKVGPKVSVTAEVTLLSPLAVLWLAHLHLQGQGGFGHDLRTSLLLAFSGPITALPLILFSAAAQRVNLGTVGLIQYINPTLQFFCAVVIFGEPLTRWHVIAFGLIWIGLALYSAQSLSQDRARRRMSVTSAAEPPL